MSNLPIVDDVPPPSPPPGPKDATFYVARPGASSPWRKLQAMLEGIHEENRAAIKEAAIAKPEGGFVDPGPYVDDPACEGVEVRVRAMSRADVADYHAQLAAVELDADASMKPMERRFREQAARARLYGGIVSKMVSGVRLDLEEARHEWEAEDREPMPAGLVDELDRAGFLFILFTVADHFQRLGPLARRDFGLRRPSISATSTAAPATKQTAALSAAPATAPGHLSSPANSLRAEHARDSGSDARRGSAALQVPSSSTGSPTASPGLQHSNGRTSP